MCPPLPFPAILPLRSPGFPDFFFRQSFKIGGAVGDTVHFYFNALKFFDVEMFHAGQPVDFVEHVQRLVCLQCTTSSDARALGLVVLVLALVFAQSLGPGTGKIGALGSGRFAGTQTSSPAPTTRF